MSNGRGNRNSWRRRQSPLGRVGVALKEGGSSGESKPEEARRGAVQGFCVCWVVAQAPLLGDVCSQLEEMPECLSP